MENSEARAFRLLRCPKCDSVLEEPGTPAYQCGGCGSLRAKIQSSSKGEVASASSPSRRRPDQTSTNREASDNTEARRQRDSGDKLRPIAAKEAQLPPRNHCRPVLKGAPFIICSSCFMLILVPAGFAVSASGGGRNIL